MKTSFLLILSLFISLTVQAQVAPGTLIRLPDLTEMKIDYAGSPTRLLGFKLIDGKLHQQEVEGLFFVDHMKMAYKVSFTDGSSLILDKEHTLITKDEVVISVRKLSPGQQVIKGGGALTTVQSIQTGAVNEKFYHFFIEGGGFYIANGIIVGDWNIQMATR